MSDTIVKPYDFRKAGTVEEPLARYLHLWGTKVAGMFRERWSHIAPSQIQVSIERCVTQPFKVLVEEMGETSIGAIINVPLGQLSTMLVTETSDLLALVLELLADPQTSRPAPRPLTSVEMNLAQMILEEFTLSLGEGWPQKDSLNCSFQALDPHPHHNRIVGGNDFVIVQMFHIDAAAGRSTFSWAIPRDSLSRSIETFTGPLTVKREGVNANIREPLMSVPVEVAVQLGTAKIPMTELSSLTPGDIIVLEQSIDDPLTVTVDGLPRYMGWPGRVADHQAFLIQSLLPRK